MADEDKQTVLIAEPGLLALGTGLPVGPSIPSYFSGETVKQVACGKDHSAVVCHSGKVFTFGKNQDNGWMEVNSNTDMVPRLVAMLATVRVSQVACGYQFNLFLTDKGQLYSCGENNYGQLGLGHTVKSPSPVPVTGLPPIKKVAAGYYHSVALAGSGEVWVAGYNGYGQLGLGNTNNQTSFILVPNLAEPIKDISCGLYHTALLSASQVLLMAGHNEYGQLGLGAIKSIFIFKRVSAPSLAVVGVSCGGNDTVALGADGTVWCFGFNDYGQLGTGDTTKRSTPTQMIGLENHTISEVIAGKYHTALLTKEGDVLVCGRGASGELGQGKKDLLVATLLTKSPGLVVKQVAFAESYSLMIVLPTAQPECGASLKDAEPRCCITDWERSIMKSLECPVCFKTMFKPIHQCLNGHSLCNTCRAHTTITVCPLCQAAFGNARNLTLESLTADIQLPCADCLQRMLTCDLESHAEICPYRKNRCPLDPSCGWSGRPDTMLAHTSSAHPDQTWRELPHLFLHSTSDELVHTDVLAAHDQVFTLHHRFSQATGEFQAFARLIDPPKDKDKFVLEFVFLSKNDELTCRRNICADIGSVDDAFQSSNCVLMKREVVDLFLQHGSLVCQATVIHVENSDLAEKVKALFVA